MPKTGVYIMGMKMPLSCADCDMIELSGPVGCVHAYASTNSSWGRALDCPLVHVPPHGRLIDADAFISFIRENWDCYDQWFAEMLESRPTIIPAEEDSDA